MRKTKVRRLPDHSLAPLVGTAKRAVPASIRTHVDVCPGSMCRKHGLGQASHARVRREDWAAARELLARAAAAGHE